MNNSLSKNLILVAEYAGDRKYTLELDTLLPGYHYHSSIEWWYPVYQKIHSYMTHILPEVSIDPYRKMKLVGAFNKIQLSLTDAASISSLFDVLVIWIKIYNHP